ncbi:hypothetical protein WG66_000428 [Moniliophthora roreri]|nr:hypothetical protein WG66_000428 [Moniliophthora roreri]
MADQQTQEQSIHDLKNGRHFHYSQAMIYSLFVTLIRDDEGNWVEPLNAGKLWKIRYADPEKIEGEMKERMARILYLFEVSGAGALAFGYFWYEHVPK